MLFRSTPSWTSSHRGLISLSLVTCLTVNSTALSTSAAVVNLPRPNLHCTQSQHILQGHKMQHNNASYMAKLDVCQDNYKGMHACCAKRRPPLAEQCLGNPLFMQDKQCSAVTHKQQAKMAQVHKAASNKTRGVGCWSSDLRLV